MLIKFKCLIYYNLSSHNEVLMHKPGLNSIKILFQKFRFTLLFKVDIYIDYSKLVIH
jgi:hypothetical protein